MPRIRKLKIYDEIPTSNIDEYNDEECVSEEQPVPEKGWWSSPKIIAALPDTKIKTAILYHKEQIKFLEQELVHRKFNNGNNVSRVIPMVPQARSTIYSTQSTSSLAVRSFKAKLRKVKMSNETRDLLISMYLISQQGAK